MPPLIHNIFNDQISVIGLSRGRGRQFGGNFCRRRGEIEADRLLEEMLIWL